MSGVAKLFWEDPYRAELDNVRVMSVDGATITVDRTIFYAFSGGQESDAGFIGDAPVLEARKIDGHDIAYTLAEGHGFTPGDVTTMRIDWERRYRLMRLHFAAELVLELVYREVKGIEKIGAHIAADKSRIDFAHGEPITPLLAGLTGDVAKLVAEDHPILSTFTDEAAQRRSWEIAGFGKVACGGTHIKRTSEIGPVRLKRDNIGKGKERINIYLL